jgi:hypothetical protein
VAPVLLGIWLMHRAAPSWLAMPAGVTTALGSTAFWRTVPGRITHAFSYQRLAASPIRRAVLGVLIAAGAFAVAPRGARWVGILAAFTIYAFADPVINAFRSRWWLNTAKSLAGFLMLFAVAAIVSELDDLGEAGMVFVLPLMVYPFAVGISGVIRLLWFHPPAA